jgi:hypothetical protein
MNKELSEEIKNYFDKVGEEHFEKPKTTVTFNDKTCTVHIQKMYHGLGNMVSFKALNWLSDKLGTEEINLRNEYYREGCDTCDFGSSHEVDIVCTNINL